MKHPHLSFILVPIVALVLGVSPVLANTQTIKSSVQFTENSYRIGPGDVLSVQVYHQTDLSQTGILVRDDGMATFPGVGDIPVAGRTAHEINNQVTDQLRDLVIEPIVTVSVTQAKPGTVYLAGAVKRPGMVQIGGASGKDADAGSGRRDLRLSNVIAMAGGITLKADLSNVEVRQNNGIRKVNLWNLVKQGDASQDLWLQSGDSVYIPESEQIAMSEQDYALVLRSSIGPGTFPVRIIGEVTTPGVYELNGESPYLNSVLAKAGGYKQGANKKIIAVRRFKDGENAETLYIEPDKSDVTLQPNDVVYISEQKIYKAGRFFETVARILSPFTAGTSSILSVMWMRNSGN